MNDRASSLAAWDVDDPQGRLRRLDLRTTERLVVTGRTPEVFIATRLARLMAPRGIDVQGCSSSESTLDPRVIEALATVGVAGTNNESGEGFSRGETEWSEQTLVVVLDLDATGAPAAVRRAFVPVGDPFDCSTTLGAALRGPSLSPREQGGSDVDARLRFTVGWLRSCLQELFSRTLEPDAFEHLD